MQTRSLDHVSVWLDGSPSDESVFPHAMDWAFRLNLPLRGIVTASRTKGVANNQVQANRPEEIDRSHGLVVEKIKSLGLACVHRGIALDMFLSLEISSDAMDQFLGSRGLCVFIEKALSPVQQELLLRSARNHEIAVLICPPTCAPMTRVMVLHQPTNPNSVYLENATRLCKALEIDPVILIVANNEREADLRQGYAEAVCKSCRLVADFDVIVDSDLRSAVGRAASWRSCSHLIIERRTTPSWWQFTNADLLEQLRGVSESLSILALPDTLAIDAPKQIRGNPSKLPVGWYAGNNPKSNKEYV